MAARVLLAVAETALLRRDYREAHAFGQQALTTNMELGMQMDLVYAIQLAGALAVLLREFERGLRLLAASQASLANMGVVKGASAQRRVDDWVAAAREQLGPERADTAWYAGRALILAEACDEACFQLPSGAGRSA